MTDHYSEFRQLPPEDDKTMKIEIAKNKQFMEFNKAVDESEVNDLIARVLDGESIMRDDGQEISIAQFVKSMDLTHYCESDVISLLCGNAASMERIELKMRERFKDEIEMMFMDYGVEVKR